ncbi:hypothetical protein EON66_05685 [archaeon]|nr:MAG: hypothetical protein EON66_05685 [archaeon]
MSSQKEVANPRTTEFEFMGPYVGPSGIILGLPILVWAFAALCSPAGWPIIPSAKVLTDLVQSSFSWNAMGVYVAWWLFQAALYLTVPGRVIPGVKLRDGSHLMYNINGASARRAACSVRRAACGCACLNRVRILSPRCYRSHRTLPAGWRCLLVTLVCTGLVHVFVHPITWICDNYLQLTVASIIFSVVLSVYLYASSFARGKMLALGGNSGIPLYDFFIGRELNPRVLGGKLDLKYFCELRPGLFLWLVINTAMLIRCVAVVLRVRSCHCTDLWPTIVRVYPLL